MIPSYSILVSTLSWTLLLHCKGVFIQPHEKPTGRHDMEKKHGFLLFHFSVFCCLFSNMFHSYFYIVRWIHHTVLNTIVSITTQLQSKMYSLIKFRHKTPQYYCPQVLLFYLHVILYCICYKIVIFQICNVFEIPLRMDMINIYAVSATKQQSRDLEMHINRYVRL